MHKEKIDKKSLGWGVSKCKKLNKEIVGGRWEQMKGFTLRKRTTPETQPYDGIEKA